MRSQVESKKRRQMAGKATGADEYRADGWKIRASSLLLESREAKKGVEAGEGKGRRGACAKKIEATDVLSSSSSSSKLEGQPPYLRVKVSRLEVMSPERYSWSTLYKTHALAWTSVLKAR